MGPVFWITEHCFLCVTRGSLVGQEGRNVAVLGPNEDHGGQSLRSETQVEVLWQFGDWGSFLMLSLLRLMQLC